jgi:hypothetical protein
LFNRKSEALNLNAWVKLSEAKQWKSITEDKVIIKHGKAGFMVLLNFCNKVWMRCAVYPIQTRFSPVYGIDQDGFEIREEDEISSDEQSEYEEIGESEESGENEEYESVESGSEERESTVPSAGRVSGSGVTGSRMDEERSVKFTPEKNGQGSENLMGLISPRGLMSASKSRGSESKRESARKGKKRGGNFSRKVSNNFGNNTVYNHNNVLQSWTIEEVHENVNNKGKTSVSKSQKSNEEAAPSCCICHSKRFF